MCFKALKEINNLGFEAKMKILLINDFFSDVGGAETYTYGLAKILEKNGHEAFFFSTDYQPYFIENYKYAKYFPKYIDFSSLAKTALPQYAIRFFYNFEAERKLDVYLKEIKPDIIHCSSVINYLTCSMLKACNKNNIPVVMTFHGARLIENKNDTKYLEKDKTCKNKLVKIAEEIEFLFRKTHKLYDTIAYFICPSQATYKLALEANIKKEKLVVVNNFISELYFKFQPEYTNKGYFLFVGRLVKEKGVHYLLEAMNRLPNIKLHIVGKGLEEDNLKKQAKQLGLSNVEFLGFKTGIELEEQYKNCIANILPCNWFEIFGLTIVESFAYGKPVIASNVGAIPEIIKSGKQGIIFEPGNVDELTEAIKKLHSDNELAIEMGKNARLKAESLYDPQVHYNHLIEVYNSVINNMILRQKNEDIIYK